MSCAEERREMREWGLLPAKPEGVQTCRECDCWLFDACWDDERGACWWVEDDLCSHCKPADD